MKHFSEITFEDESYSRKKVKGGSISISDTIYSLDIETTSLYYIDGIWQPFDYSRDASEYNLVQKASVPYIFMFGVEDEVYYGRDFYDIEKVLKMISNPHLTKVLWIHNASFEMHFMLDILQDYTIENMVCRDVMKPISFTIKELNIIVRCSYMLTNMSLDVASKEYGSIHKKSGDLNYDLSRGSTTPLSDVELGYCEYDIKAVYSIVDFFRKRYKHIGKIPLTSTGEVRQALRERLDYFYFKDNSWKLVPTKDIYLKLMATFAGGYTHANALNANKTIRNVSSYDEASAYPACMVTEKFPSTPFKRFTKERYEKLKDNYCFFFEIRFKGVKSRFYNHYIPFYKMYEYETDSLTTDNGRLVSCDSFKLWVTDVDLELIQMNYDIEEIEYLQIYGSYKDYLDIRIIKYILELYGNKTKLKGIPEFEDLYRKSKQYNNCLYGMSVTNPLKNSATFTIEEGWKKVNVSDDEEFDSFVDDVLEKQQHSFSNLFFFGVGVWVTSYCRRNVVRILLNKEMDRDACYVDTDSVKFKGKHDSIFEEYNQQLVKKYEAVCRHFNGQIKLSDFMPEDSDGNKRPIGFFECETPDEKSIYSEFRTLGAKKYCYRDASGLHLTVSGVNKKKGISVLEDDINNFKKGLVFDYEHSGKLTHIYINEQPEFEFVDYLGNVQYNKQKHGVVLQPTTYRLGIDEYFEALIKDYQSRKVRK